MALHHAKPGEIVDFAPIGPELREAKTAAIIKTDHSEAVRLIVHAGAEIPQHKVSGEITLHCLQGHVELGIDPRPIVLKSNDWGGRHTSFGQGDQGFIASSDNLSRSSSGKLTFLDMALLVSAISVKRV